MSTSQADADAFMTEFNTLKGKEYFDSCTGLLYKLLATGNFWNPYEGK
jgi:hypothetical protein